MPKYVLVTAAKNEEAYIEMTILSVLKQSVLPEEWVIVSDGSSDNTEGIVKKYSSRHKFIKLIAVIEAEERTFAGKVFAIKMAVESLNTPHYDFIGNLDADVSFGPFFYELMMQKFQDDKNLGVCGGVRHDVVNDQHLKIRCPRSTVSGASIFFRKKVFTEIEGFLPMPKGGEDTIAGIMARMNGWKVASFPDVEFLHHRRTGSASAEGVLSSINHGVRDYHIGYHPLYELAKCLYRLKDRPFVLGSLLSLFGYIKSALCREERVIPKNVVEFVKEEQLAKIFRFGCSKC
jgi:glycosyltransferase involved in cell wall biosynthesis